MEHALPDADLQELAQRAAATGAISYVTDEAGRRIAAVVPVPVAEHAERLRASTEAADAELDSPRA